MIVSMAQPLSSSAPLAWSLSVHQGYNVALPKPRGAVEGHRPETPDLAKSPDSRPAGGEHLHDLRYPQKAFGWLPGLLPELGRAPAAIQDGLPVLQREGRVEFQGGFDEAMEGGKHEAVLSPKCRIVNGAGWDFYG